MAWGAYYNASRKAELLVQIIDVKLLRVQLEKSSKLLLPCQNLGVKQIVHNGEVSQFPGWHHDVRQMSVSQVFISLHMYIRYAPHLF